MYLFFLFLMVLFYLFGGVMHFISPEFYLQLMPAWMPSHFALIYLSGVAEILLALGLIFNSTRKISAWLIIAMLIVFFIFIHVPQAIDFYQISHPYFWATLVRLPLQFLLIWWAWVYTKPAPKPKPRLY